MKKILNYTALLALCAMVVLSSCSKDDDDETLLYLDGSPHFELPMYASVGDTLTLYASGVYTENVTYQWSFPCLDTVAFLQDTMVAVIHIPDTLGTFTVTLTADAGAEYYSASTPYTITSLSPQSITGLAVPQNRFVDPRDSNIYPTVEIGNLEWFAKNLNWEGKGAGYAKTDAASRVMGRFYTWNDATGGVSASGLGNGVQGVCPEGWSIPTREDWIDLAMAINGGVEVDFLQDWKDIAGLLMAPAKLNGNVMWPYSPKVNHTNDYGWNALPAGSSYNNYNNYQNINDYGFWWCSTERDSSTAHYRYIFKEYPDVSVNYTAKDGLGANVRCVRLIEK